MSEQLSLSGFCFLLVDFSPSIWIFLLEVKPVSFSSTVTKLASDSPSEGSFCEFVSVLDVDSLFGPNDPFRPGFVWLWVFLVMWFFLPNFLDFFFSSGYIHMCNFYWWFSAPRCLCAWLGPFHIILNWCFSCVYDYLCQFYWVVVICLIGSNIWL